jgi:hypothetical protein
MHYNMTGNQINQLMQSQKLTRNRDPEFIVFLI